MNGPQSFSNSIPERNSSPSNNVRQDFVETRSLPSEIKMENEDGSQQWDTIPRSIVPSSGAQTSINMTITTSTLPNNPHQLDPHRPTINDSEVASHIGSHTPHQLKSHSSQHTPDHTRKRGASEGTVMKRRATPNLNGLETTSNPGTGSNGRGRESSSAGGDITKSKQASGNGNGNGNNAKSKKKKRRKGWKGYAVVDADGNIIESEEEEDESPLFQDRPLFETDDGTLSHRDGASATDEGTTGSQYKLQDGKGRDLPESDKVVEIDMPPTRQKSAPVQSNTAIGPTSAEVNKVNAHEDIHVDVEHAVNTAPPPTIKQAALKKRPKTTASTTPQPNAEPGSSTSRSTSSLPRPLHPVKPLPAKTLRSVNRDPTARQALTHLIGNGNNTLQSRNTAGSQFVVEDDSPLPKVPRIGMGEEFVAPPLSDIRTEADYIIREAAKRREADTKAAKRRDRMNRRNGHQRITPPPSAYPEYPSPGSAGPSTYHDRSSYPDVIYDMTMYDSTVNDNKTFGQRPLQNDPRPPKFTKDQAETVVLAPNGHRPKARDLVERLHEEGFEGLTPELEADAAGFVTNVKMNLRSILEVSFPQPSARRDAFLEKIGRGLADLGWRMTDASDAAF